VGQKAVGTGTAALDERGTDAALRVWTASGSTRPEAAILGDKGGGISHSVSIAPAVLHLRNDHQEYSPTIELRLVRCQ
jgi:hypothetical protein